MFCIKVFSLQFTTWSCTSYSPCDRNHHRLLVNKVFVVHWILCEKWTIQIFCEKSSRRPCHAIPTVRYNPHSRLNEGNVVTVVRRFCWYGSKCASRVCTTTFGNGRFYRKHQPLWISVPSLPLPSYQSRYKIACTSRDQANRQLQKLYLKIANESSI